MSQQPDYYAVLGVPPDATPEEIQRAYRQLARRYHPDTNNTTGALERFLEIQEAYQVLSDPQRRAAYDATLPPMAEAEGVLFIRQLRYPPHLMPLQEPQLFYLLVTVQSVPDTEGLPASAPLNMALVLDRSTSMKGSRIQALIKATEALIANLEDQDIFSIVAFDDRAEVLVPATRGANKDYMLHQLRLLEPKGGTEIYQGLRAGLEQVQRFRSEGYLNHILLITDGHTYGDEPACLELARQAAAQGVTISALGIGTDWNDAFLDELTSLTGGNCWHIAQVPHLERVLGERFRALGQVLADRALARWYLPPGVALQAAFRAAPDPGPLALQTQPIPLGAVQRRVPLQVLFEFLIASEALRDLEEGFLLLPAQFVFSVPGRAITWHRQSLRLRVPVREEPPSLPPTRELLEVLNRFTLYRLQEKARQSAEAGDLAGATRRLEHLATRLLEIGHQDMAALVRQEADMLQRRARLSPEATKAIKFGTRALFLLPAGDQSKPGGQVPMDGE